MESFVKQECVVVVDRPQTHGALVLVLTDPLLDAIQMRNPVHQEFFTLLFRETHICVGEGLGNLLGVGHRTNVTAHAGGGVVVVGQAVSFEVQEGRELLQAVRTAAVLVFDSGKNASLCIPNLLYAFRYMSQQVELLSLVPVDLFVDGKRLLVLDRPVALAAVVPVVAFPLEHGVNDVQVLQSVGQHLFSLGESFPADVAEFLGRRMVDFAVPDHVVGLDKLQKTVRTSGEGKGRGGDRIERLDITFFNGRLGGSGAVRRKKL